MPLHNGSVLPSLYIRGLIAVILIGGALALLLIGREVPGWFQVLVGIAVGFWLRGELGGKEG